MAQQTPPPPNPTQDAQPTQAVIGSTPTKENKRPTEEQTADVLKEIQEDAGQISELATEEENLVREFFSFLQKILKPFGKTLEISSSSLPENYEGRVSKAYLYLTGQLVVVFKNGEVEILNLADKENHEVLVEITGEIVVKLKTIINFYKASTEKRVKFLMTVTKELQKVAEVFSENTSTT